MPVAIDRRAAPRRAGSTSAAAISPTGRIRSTAPAAIAALGMPSYSASSGSCAMAKPPASCSAFSPSEPSAPVPDRITPMVRAAQSSASEWSRKSNGSRAPWRAPGVDSCSLPRATRKIAAGRNDIEMLGRDDRHRRPPAAPSSTYARRADQPSCFRDWDRDAGSG